MEQSLTQSNNFKYVDHRFPEVPLATLTPGIKTSTKCASFSFPISDYNQDVRETLFNFVRHFAINEVRVTDQYLSSPPGHVGCSEPIMVIIRFYTELPTNLHEEFDRETSNAGAEKGPHHWERTMVGSIHLKYAKEFLNRKYWEEKKDIT